MIQTTKNSRKSFPREELAARSVADFCKPCLLVPSSPPGEGMQQLEIAPPSCFWGVKPSQQVSLAFLLRQDTNAGALASPFFPPSGSGWLGRCPATPFCPPGPGGRNLSYQVLEQKPTSALPPSLPSHQPILMRRIILAASQDLSRKLKRSLRCERF